MKPRKDFIGRNASPSDDFEADLKAAESQSSKQLVVIGQDVAIVKPEAKGKRLHFDWSDTDKVKLVIDDFEKWLAAADANVWGVDFCKEVRDQYNMPLYWFQYLEDHLSTDFWDDEVRKQISGVWTKIKAVVAQKLIKQSANRNLDVSSVIFTLKARHGWRDGNEKNASTTNQLNIFNIEGLSLKELQSKVDGLISAVAQDTEAEAIETKFEELK